MQIFLPRPHGGRQVSSIDGQEACGAGIVAIGPDPYRNAPVLAGCLVAASNTFHQHAMRGAYYALGHRQLVQQALRFVHRRAVIEHLEDVAAPLLRQQLLGARLQAQHLPHRCVRSFDAGRQHGFLGGQRRQQQLGVGNHRQSAVVSRDSSRGRAKERDQRVPVECSRRKRARWYSTGIGRGVVDRPLTSTAVVAHCINFLIHKAPNNEYASHNSNQDAGHLEHLRATDSTPIVPESSAMRHDRPRSHIDRRHQRQMVRRYPCQRRAVRLQLAQDRSGMCPQPVQREHRQP